MLNQLLEFSIFFSFLFLYDRLRRRLLQELGGAEQKLIESNPFHSCLHANGDFAVSLEMNQ
jgi:hypothetical protein